MKRSRIIALALALCLLLGGAPATTASSAGVYFTMINSNEPLPLDKNTMPYNQNGEIYVPLSTLQQVGINCMTQAEGMRLYSVRDNDYYLEFNLETGKNVTHQGTSLTISSPLLRENEYFYPAKSVCMFFGVKYQILQTSPAPIVRLSNESVYIMSDQTVQDNAEEYFNLSARYDAYMGTTSNNSQTSSDVVGAPTTDGGQGVDEPMADPVQDPVAIDSDDDPDDNSQEQEDREEDDPEASASPVVSVSLNFSGLTEDTGELLTRLDAAGITAGFFVTQADIQSDPDLIRRIHGEGHQLGIYLRENAEGEYSAASDALFDAAKVRTLLVAAETDEVAGQAEELGLITLGGTTAVSEMDSADAFLADYTGGRLLLSSGDIAGDVLSALASRLGGSGYSVTVITELI